MKNKTPEIFRESLEFLFPNVGSFLEGETDFQFLVAVLLSAQMTDVGVNKATKDFFKVMKTPHDAFLLGESNIYNYIKTINFAPTKAKNIFKTSEYLVKNFHGKVPTTREELIKLFGVGNKTAGVFVLQRGYGYAFPVDTHISRVAQSFGFTKTRNADQVESDLQKLFPKESWNTLHLQIILYGRNYLTARNIPESPEKAWEDLNTFCAQKKEEKIS